MIGPTPLFMAGKWRKGHEHILCVTNVCLCFCLNPDSIMCAHLHSLGWESCSKDRNIEFIDQKSNSERNSMFSVRYLSLQGEIHIFTEEKFALNTKQTNRE